MLVTCKKKRELENSKVDLSTICRQPKIKSLQGKKYAVDCAPMEGLLRIIVRPFAQSPHYLKLILNEQRTKILAIH